MHTPAIPAMTMRNRVIGSLTEASVKSCHIQTQARPVRAFCLGEHMLDPVEYDWHHYDAIEQRKEDEYQARQERAEENQNAVLTATSGSELLPVELKIRYIKTVFDVASELSAGTDEDATLVSDALYAGSDWEDAGLRIAFDGLIQTRRDVIQAVARYAYELTMEHML